MTLKEYDIFTIQQQQSPQQVNLISQKHKNSLSAKFQFGHLEDAIHEENSKETIMGPHIEQQDLTHQIDGLSTGTSNETKTSQTDNFS